MAEPTAAAPAAQPAAAAPPAGDAHAQAGPAAAQAAAEAQAGQKFIKVDATALGGVSWHDVAAQAKAYRELEASGRLQSIQQGGDARALAEKIGVPADKLDAFLGWLEQAPELSADAGAPASPGDGHPGDGPLTLAGLNRVLDERDRARQDREQTAQRQQDERQARQGEAAHGLGVLEKAGIKVPTDGTPIPSPARVAWSIWSMAIQDARSEAIPLLLSPDEKADALRAPATPAQLARAEEIFSAALTDWKNTAGALLAQGQPKIPASLGAGPGGKAPPDYSKMTMEQRLQYVQTGQMPPGL